MYVDCEKYIKFGPRDNYSGKRGYLEIFQVTQYKPKPKRNQ